MFLFSLCVYFRYETKMLKLILFYSTNSMGSIAKMKILLVNICGSEKTSYTV